MFFELNLLKQNFRAKILVLIKNREILTLVFRTKRIKIKGDFINFLLFFKKNIEVTFLHVVYQLLKLLSVTFLQVGTDGWIDDICYEFSILYEKMLVLSISNLSLRSCFSVIFHEILCEIKIKVWHFKMCRPSNNSKWAFFCKCGKGCNYVTP